jgi:MraZ protein
MIPFFPGGEVATMCNSLKVDQKGRLKIPIALLNKLTALGSELYVTSENGVSVRIYPMRVWNEVEGQLERLCLHNNQKLLARVKYFGGAVRLDKQGRVIIPLVLRKHAQIKGNVDVLDYVNYLEVWNHGRLMNHLKGNSMVARNEKTLDELVSGLRTLRSSAGRHKSRYARGKVRRFGIHRRFHSNSHGQLSREIRASRAHPPEHSRVA